MEVITDLTHAAFEAQANGVAKGGAEAGLVERLERDAGGLTDEQRMAAVMADAPELTALLSELRGSLAEVRSHVGPLLKEVSNAYSTILPPIMEIVPLPTRHEWLSV